jgi:hypothetical protein
MKYNPHQLRADINRIAALKIEDINLKAFRDRLLIGYTYFLDPGSYLICYKEDISGTSFLTSDRTDTTVNRRAMHPLVTRIFNEYNNELPVISDPARIKEYLKILLPSIQSQPVNFNAQQTGLAVQAAENLDTRHMDMLICALMLPHLEAVLLEHLHEGITCHHNAPYYLQSKAALEEFFDHHPFFHHLRIRLASVSN